MWLNFTKGTGESITVVRRGRVGVVTMSRKVVSFFKGQIRVTRSVAAPGDTNPSDATVIASSNTTAMSIVYWANTTEHTGRHFNVGQLAVVVGVVMATDRQEDRLQVSK